MRRSHFRPKVFVQTTDKIHMALLTHYTCMDCGSGFNIPINLTQCPFCSSNLFEPNSVRNLPNPSEEVMSVSEWVSVNPLKCECGAHSVGVDKHADWCALSKITISSEELKRTIGLTSYEFTAAELKSDLSTTFEEWALAFRYGKFGKKK